MSQKGSYSVEHLDVDFHLWWCDLKTEDYEAAKKAYEKLKEEGWHPIRLVQVLELDNYKPKKSDSPRRSSA